VFLPESEADSLASLLCVQTEATSSLFEGRQGRNCEVHIGILAVQLLLSISSEASVHFQINVVTAEPRIWSQGRTLSGDLSLPENFRFQASPCIFCGKLRL
jgi:hypothetical protein